MGGARFVTRRAIVDPVPSAVRTMHNNPWRLACSVLAMVVAGNAIADDAAVERFSPLGRHSDVHQVEARFDRPMVAFGAPDLPAPFSIDCPVPGRGQWVDPRHWIYDFDDPVPAAVTCRFSTDVTFSAVDGAPLRSGSFEFTTGGARIVHLQPWESHDAVDESQVFLLGLDAPVKPASVESGAWCEIDGVGERVGVELLDQAAKRALLDQYPDFIRGYRHALTGYGRQPITMMMAAAPLSGDEDERMDAVVAAEPSPIVALRCKRRLTPDADVTLVWGRAIETASGMPGDQTRRIDYHVRDAFRARFDCRRVNADAGCNPVLPMTVGFTAPVARDAAARITLSTNNGDTFYPDLEGEDREWIDAVGFPGPFLQDTEYTLDLPRDLVDDAGRSLANAARFPLSVSTDAAAPLVKFPAAFGLVEFDEQAALPITLRNIESVVPLAPAPGETTDDANPLDTPWLRRWYERFRERIWPRAAKINGRMLRIGDAVAAVAGIERVREFQRERGHYDATLSKWVVDSRPGERSLFGDDDVTEAFTLPKPGGRRAMEVIGIPFARPGFYLVEIASPRLGAALYGDATPYHAQTAVLVTDLAAHFKHGRESSLVWVTRLRSGRPAAGARVTVRDCAGALLFEGTSDADGLVRIGAPLPELPGGCHDYIVAATLGADMTFTLSGWNEGIENWRFNLPGAPWSTPNLAATVFDRPLYRAGETVHMKHVLRRHAGDGFAIPARGRLPRNVTVTHEGSGDTFEVAAVFDDSGIAENAWSIPAEARAGRYRVEVSVDEPGRGKIRLEAGRFRVEAFKVPVMEANVVPVPERPVRPADVAVDVQVNYHNGGGAGGLDVTVRSAGRERSVRFDDYDDYRFGNGAVAEGIEHDDDVGAGQSVPAEHAVRLDANGGARVRLEAPVVDDVPVDWLVEVEYPDANGEILTRAARATLWPSAVVVGIRPDGWAASRERLAFDTVVLDLQGNALPRRVVRVDAYRRAVYSHRKRLVGGFYAYESRRETVRLGRLCEGETDALGRFACEVPAPDDGNIVLHAVAVDDDGNESHAHRDVWVAGGDEWWFDVGNEDRMDLLAERRRVEPGDTARLQARMPFRRATALVTVEREGILDAFVTTIEGTAPVIEVPVEGRYAPNVFVSVLAVRGRTDASRPTALVDLDKPAFRLGVAELTVGHGAHRLDVDVRADRDAYAARGVARVDIRVATPGGAPLPGDAEVAVAAVDEGLLALAPNESWNLLETMMGRRGMEVRTATAQMQVVGKRHFGKKALAAGGGGGRDATRELFDTLLYWQGRVPLDAAGRARVEVPLNDSLTAFRIVAVATAGAGLFGAGETTIRSIRNVMLLPGIPGVVRRGDAFDALLTVRNAAVDGASRDILVRASIGGKALPEHALSLDAGTAVELAWPVNVTRGMERLEFAAEALVDGVSVDRIALARDVLDPVPVRVQQGTLLRLDASARLPVAPPAGALPGRGGVRVSLSSSLVDALPGVVSYMRDYPHACLEQRVSRAVAIGGPSLEAAVGNQLAAFLDDDGLARYWPSMDRGDDVLTSYVLAVTDAAGWRLPEAPRERMLDALAGFLDGRLTRRLPMHAADLAVRRLAAMDALSRYRALDPQWLTAMMIAPESWPTSALIDWINILSRGDALADRDALLRRARSLLRARLDFRGTTMGFSTEARDNLWWLMVSGDVNAARAVLAVIDDEDFAADLPRMMRGLLARRQHGRWSTTIANAWGAVAAGSVRSRLQADDVGGVTRASLGAAREWSWGEDPAGGEITLPWPDGAAALRLDHDGTGSPWATVESLAAVPPAAAVSRGYTVTRRVEVVTQKTPGAWRRGDVAKVILDIDAAADRTWVVVDDPVPAGAVILGTGFGTDSAMLSSAHDGEISPAFVERATDAFRAYFEYMPRGRWRVSYNVRYNASGEFALPPTRVEAMYAPETHGERPNDPVAVRR